MTHLSEGKSFRAPGFRSPRFGVPGFRAPRFGVALAALTAGLATASAAIGPSIGAGAPAPMTEVDTAWTGPFFDSSPGTGMRPSPGRGGASGDSAYGPDTLWSSPYDPPATPGSGLPNTPGSGWPGTGAPGSTGNGGTGNGGTGMGRDSAGPGSGMPGIDSTAPRDSIGAPDWMERG